MRPEPGLAALWVDDVYARTTICVEQWASILQARDSRTLLARLKKAGLPDWTPAYHVAVDRWTGGAADRGTVLRSGALEPGLGADPLDRRPAPLKDDERLPALALLFLTLGDLASPPEMPVHPAWIRDESRHGRHSRRPVEHGGHRRRGGTSPA